jgi:hypothetical protein
MPWIIGHCLAQNRICGMIFGYDHLDLREPVTRPVQAGALALLLQPERVSEIGRDFLFESAVTP